MPPGANNSHRSSYYFFYLEIHQDIIFLYWGKNQKWEFGNGSVLNRAVAVVSQYGLKMVDIQLSYFLYYFRPPHLQVSNHGGGGGGGGGGTDSLSLGNASESTAPVTLTAPGFCHLQI